MAAVAEIIERFALDHPGAESAVVVMAVRAFQLPLAYRMVGSFVLLHPDRSVANVAKVGLGSLEVLPSPRVHRVAVVAGDVGALMLA